MNLIGLVASHAVRLLIGFCHRLSVPLSAMLGSIVVVMAETVGRTPITPTEILSGLVTALLVTPYLLWLMHYKVV